jgi:hypothetical protein
MSMSATLHRSKGIGSWEMGRVTERLPLLSERGGPAGGEGDGVVVEVLIQQL